MTTEVKTQRVRRSWTDKLQLWPRAYETKIFDERHEAFGRGRTREASREAAMRRWEKVLHGSEKYEVRFGLSTATGPPCPVTGNPVDTGSPPQLSAAGGSAVNKNMALDGPGAP